jgi:glycosyltransferase involved in cell wall biosynthesis
VRILYVNHTARISGGERSLLDLLGGLPEEVERFVACPPGALANAARALGVPVSEVKGTDTSLKLHPMRTLRGIGELVWLSRCVAHEASRVWADLVHANSIRAGIATSLPLARTLPPTVVHVRDCLPPGLASTAVRRLIHARARVVVSNSAYTERCFAVGAPRRARAAVLHSPVDLRRFDARVVDRARARERLGLPADAPVLTVVAQLTPWKGQCDAVRTLELVRRRGIDARLLLVGAPTFVSRDTRYDNLAYLSQLRALIAEVGLEERVAFLGERADVPEVLGATDVLLVPSWEEPLGRAVLEGMAMGLPVLATDRGGPAELVTHGVDGFLLAPRDPAAWATAIIDLLEDADRRAEIGRAARRRAHSFGVDAHVEKIVGLYSDVVGGGRLSSPARSSS